MTAPGDAQVRRRRPAWAHLALVGAVVATSSSALLARWADAPPLALAFWRTLGGALILSAPLLIARISRPAAATAGATGATGPGVLDGAGRSTMAEPEGSARQWLLLVAAGTALGLHFASWLASLELTTVAASTTLVTMTPLLLAGYLTAIGQPPTAAGWLALGTALVGAVVITVGDIGTDLRAIAGDALALAGAAFMATQLRIGERLRRTMSTVDYAGRIYAIAASVTFVIAVVAGIELWRFDRDTWLAIIGMILGPQLAGHTVFNLLLKQLGSVTISLALLAEPLGATLLVLVFLGEVPPITVLIGAPLILGGLALHLRQGSADRVTTPSGTTA